MSTASTIVPRTAQALQSMIAGNVFVPGDAGYDDARRAFFLNVDQQPPSSWPPSPSPTWSGQSSSPPRARDTAGDRQHAAA